VKHSVKKSAEPITFRHPYYKLAGGTFTTIRGKAQFKRRKVGDVVPIETPTENYNAVIIKLELKRVSDMTLEFLKADAEYPGCTIGRHEHFVNLLNSFRAPAWTRCTLDSELTIITLSPISSLQIHEEKN
jgi:hypothetical protein